MNISTQSPYSKILYIDPLSQIILCYKTQNWDKLFEMINFLMNRRGQGKKAQIEMIQLAMTWINESP